MTVPAGAYLQDHEIVEAILGKVTPEELARYGPSVLALWKPRFATATERCFKYFMEPNPTHWEPEPKGQ